AILHLSLGFFRHWDFVIRHSAMASPISRLSELLAQLQKSLGHLRPFAFLLVLEKDERVLPVFLAHALRPRLQLRIAIVRPSQSQITPIRCRYERNLKIIFRFGDAKRS